MHLVARGVEEGQGDLSRVDSTSDAEDDEDVEEESPRPFVKSTAGPNSVVLKVDLTAVFLVYVVNFLDSLGGSISTPILPFYARAFNANYTEVGYLFSSFAMAQVLSMPFLSFLSDKRGRRNVIILATLGTGLGALWQGTATSYNSLLASRIFSGLWSGVASVCQVYIVDVVTSPSHRADYLSYLNSSTQASVLFGPSIGAGLSALGYNVPVLVQAAVSFVLSLIIWAHLPESPEWCRLHMPASPNSPSFHSGGTRQPKTRQVGLGRRVIVYVVLAYGALSLCGMVAQMSIMSMFAVYAEQTFGLNSVEVGFTMTLGAIASVATNIWISPPLLRGIGALRSSLLGFVLMFVGGLVIAMQPYWLSVVGFMIAYQGLAINSSAVATGAANLTDQWNRATIMTGTRMFKSAGAVIGPMVSGPLATMDVRYPFLCASAFAVVGMSTQVISMPLMRYVMGIIEGRKVVGQESGLLDGEWLDEHGTEEEIRDLGDYVANLLTTRHYRWVTYNQELRNFLSDSFPEVSIESEEKHKRDYDRRRRLVREHKEMSYRELLDMYKQIIAENSDLRKQMRSIPSKGKSEKLESAEAGRRLTVIQTMCGPGDLRI